MSDALSAERENPDTGLACLAIVARLHGLPADPEQLQHRFVEPGKPADLTALLRAAKFVGLKATRISIAGAALSETPLPAIAPYDDGYVVVAKASEHQLLILNPSATQPQSVDIETFGEHWSGDLIVVTRRAKIGAQEQSFDFSWFIPAIIKHRKLLGEVLLASFFMQLFALITPLFFQVVIDKVLVHRGLTTLDVLAIGLLVVSAFEVILGGLRTYVFSHTTNRIDVGLGAKLFEHLQALPISYFETRRVGDTVARVKELESIRNFLTGSSLTVVVDLFFTFVFLTVMYYYSPTLTYIVLAALPCYALLSFVITPILRTRLKEKFNRGAENQAFLVESVNGIETIKAAAVEPQGQKRWEEQLAAYVQASFKATNLGNVANQTASFINKITILLILWIGARLVINGDLSVGQLVAFNMLAARVSVAVSAVVARLSASGNIDCSAGRHLEH